VCVYPSLSGVKSPTRSSVTASSNLRRARRTSTALSVACSSLRQKPGEQLLCCSHTLHSWHSLLCGCHSCDSDGLALTGPQSLVLRLVWATLLGDCRHTVRPWVRGQTTLPALGHIGPEVRSIYSVDDKTCLPAGAEQEGPAHNPLVNSPSTPRTMETNSLPQRCGKRQRSAGESRPRDGRANMGDG